MPSHGSLSIESLFSYGYPGVQAKVEKKQKKETPFPTNVFRTSFPLLFDSVFFILFGSGCLVTRGNPRDFSTGERDIPETGTETSRGLSMPRI